MAALGPLAALGQALKQDYLNSFPSKGLHQGSCLQGLDSCSLLQDSASHWLCAGSSPPARQ